MKKFEFEMSGKRVVCAQMVDAGGIVTEDIMVTVAPDEVTIFTSAPASLFDEALEEGNVAAFEKWLASAETDRDVSSVTGRGLDGFSVADGLSELAVNFVNSLALEPKKLHCKVYGMEKEFILEVTSYTADNSLAIHASEEVDGYPEPYGNITKYVDFLGYQNLAAVDTNGMPGIDEAIERSGIAVKVGEVQTGYCTYPIFSFNLEKLALYDECGVLELMALPYSGEKEYKGED